jgi:hypothetical protein
MTTAIPDLWPPSFGEEQIIVPVVVLRQQAEALNQRTKNVIVAKVESYTDPNDKTRVVHELVVEAPVLNTETRIVRVGHRKQHPYSADVQVPKSDAWKTQGTANTYDELVSLLRDVLTSERVVESVRNLLVQSQNM